MIVEYRSPKHERLLFRPTEEELAGLTCPCGGGCMRSLLAHHAVLDKLRDLKAVKTKGSC
jgi:hypothetical protein